MKLSFDHVTLTVSDLERSIEFYRDTLGLKVLGKIEQPDAGLTIVYFEAGEGVLELFYFSDEEDSDLNEREDTDIGLQHIGFGVSNVDEVADKLRRNDVEFTLEPMDAGGGVRIAFFKDPDGILLELVEGELDLEQIE